MNARGWTLLASLSLVLLARPAHASCVAGTSCICQPAASIAEATVEAVDGPQTTVLVGAVFVADGGTSDAGAATTLTLARQPTDSAGSQTLIYLQSNADITFRVPVDSSGAVICSGTPNFHLPTAEAIQAALSADCDTALGSQGFPPCNEGMCAAFPDSQSSWMAGVAATLFWARRGRRQRRTPT